MDDLIGGTFGPLVTRPANPGPGATGRPVRLFANFLTVQTDKTLTVYDFRVDFEPEVESIKVRYDLVDQVADKFRNSEGQVAYVYDGFHNLKALTPVSVDQDTIRLTVKRNDDESAGDAASDQQLILKRSEDPVSWGSFEMLRLYNTLMRRNLHKHLNWMRVHRHYYDRTTSCSLLTRSGPPINLVLGMATAINYYDSELLMSCGSISKIIRSDKAIDVMKGLHQRSPADFENQCYRQMVGSVVLTTYNNQSYKIDDIAHHINPTHTFDRKGQEITFVDYYKQTYNLEIKDLCQPLLVVMPGRRATRAAARKGVPARILYLIPELCVMTGLPEYLRHDMDMKKQLTQATQFSPEQRFDKLMHFQQQLQDNESVRNELQVWGMSYSASPVEVEGRVLEKEVLQTGGQIIPIQSPGDFSNEVRNCRMIQPKPWTACAILFQDRQVIEQFLQKMEQSAVKMGIGGNNVRKVQLPDTRTGSYVSAIRDLLNQTPEGPQKDRLVICVVPNNQKDRYDAIKKLTCCEAGCASQVILTRTLSMTHKLAAITTKIVMQMACKVGSVPWSLHIQANDLMVIGYDLHRDPSRRGESAGAFVCSLNQPLTKYYSLSSYHNNWDAMSQNIAVSFRRGLEKYRQVNHQLPKRVILFRDGLSEGMMAHVFQVEVKQMQQVIQDMEADIQLAVVVVSKSSHTKFFVSNNQKEVTGNPEPGTVVDSVVTRPERLEFYLVSQSVRHGTVCPTSYNVICNQTKFELRHLQTLTYKLTHLYFNWQGTVRVPAPCQYARKLAILTCNSLHGQAHDDLSDRLFYL